MTPTPAPTVWIEPAVPAYAGIENLRAAGPAPGLPEAIQDFGQFVGVWDLDVSFFNPDGKLVRRTPAVWMFSWVLDGRGIQDVIVLPRPSDPRGERGIGTTLRYFDVSRAVWKATFVGAQSGTFINLEGKRMRDRIVLNGRDMDGSSLQWSFDHITADSFHWVGYSSPDQGRTWWKEQEMEARRRRPETRFDSPAVLWRRLDTAGTESARLSQCAGGWELSGSAAFQSDEGAASLGYVVDCTDDWEFRSARVTGWLGVRPVRHEIRRSESGEWTLDGVPRPDLAGCVDFDLNFSPSTNLLPIRRLALKQGQSSQVTAAWLRFPSFRLERLFQTYRRSGKRTYHYESGPGSFSAELSVDEDGMVMDYPPFWQRVVEATRPR